MSEIERDAPGPGTGSASAMPRMRRGRLGRHPPEGRYTRDRADPGFWQRQWQPAAAGAVLFVLVVIVLLLAVL